jgi:hypothetical protein
MGWKNVLNIEHICNVEKKIYVRRIQIYLAHLVGMRELLHHNSKSTRRNIVTWIHTGICRGYNGHEMLPIPRELPWVPHSEAKFFIFFYRTEHHRVRPTPLSVHTEKSANEHARNSIRKELAHTGHQQGQVHASKKTRYLSSDVD